MREDSRDVSADLSALTTLRLGGPAAELVEITDQEQLPQIVRDHTGDLLVVAGGSNLVIGDDGFPGTVLLLRTRGVRIGRVRNGRTGEPAVTVTVAAGQPWDEVVARTVAEGWAGLECLSGVPGSAGATPIQNVGAYGQEVAETISSVRVYDRGKDETVDIPAAECGFTYRGSLFKYADRWIVQEVTFELREDAGSVPIRYPELARSLDVPVGAVAPLADVRAAVLRLRAGKGMVLDATDPDTRSVGSFFTNPILTAAGYERFQSRAAGLGEPPAWPAGDGAVKLSAAWLIERAGFHRGYGRGGVSISTKHTLALTHRGGGSTGVLLDLAREIRDGVRDRFGVELHPEPVLVNCAL